jgi:hypothetical protein
MKVAIIAPVDMLELAALTDYHLVLPHMVTESKIYERFYTDVEGFKILDNGAAEPEGLSGDPSYLHDIGLHTGCHELVVPDALGDCERTIRLARSFERSVRRRDFSYVGVAQGGTLAELVKCVNYFSHCDWIDTLALPRIINKIHKTQRFNPIEPLMKEYAPNFPGGVHCLGASSWIREVVAIDELGLVRGIDTSLPIVMGLANRNIRFDGYEARRGGYFSEKVERNQPRWRQICDNVGTYLDWAGYIGVENSPEAS